MANLGAFYDGAQAAIVAGTYDFTLAGSVVTWFVSADYVFDGSHEQSDITPYRVADQTINSAFTTFNTTTKVWTVSDSSYSDSFSEGGIARYLILFSSSFGDPLVFFDLLGAPIVMESPLPRSITIRFPSGGAFDATNGIVRRPIMVPTWDAVALGYVPPLIVEGRVYDGISVSMGDTQDPNWESDDIRYALVGSSDTDPEDRYTFDSSHASLDDVTQGTWATGAVPVNSSLDNQQIVLADSAMTITLGTFDLPVLTGDYQIDGIIIYSNDDPTPGDTRLMFYIDQASNEGLPTPVYSGATITVEWWRNYVVTFPYDYGEATWVGKVIAPKVHSTAHPAGTPGRMLRAVRDALRAILPDKITKQNRHLRREGNATHGGALEVPPVLSDRIVVRLMASSRAEAADGPLVTIGANDPATFAPTQTQPSSAFGSVSFTISALLCSRNTPDSTEIRLTQEEFVLVADHFGMALVEALQQTGQGSLWDRSAFAITCDVDALELQGYEAADNGIDTHYIDVRLRATATYDARY